MSLNYTLEPKKNDLYFVTLIFRQKLNDISRITESQLIAYLLTNIKLIYDTQCLTWKNWKIECQVLKTVATNCRDKRISVIYMREIIISPLYTTTCSVTQTTSRNRKIGINIQKFSGKKNQGKQKMSVKVA